MAKRSIYRSQEGQAAVMALYDRQLAALGPGLESRVVATPVGDTHVLVAGPADAPPVLVLPPLLTPAPYCLELCRPLADHYRLYLPDPPGQPGRSAQTRVETREHGFGKWAEAVMAGLELPPCAVVGMSFGAGILLDLAAHAPGRITRAVLLVPRGLAPSRYLTLLLRVALPLMTYRFSPSQERLLRALAPLHAEPEHIGEEQLAWFDAVARHVRWAVNEPPPAEPAQLAEFRAPVLVLAARDDLLVPARRVGARAERLLPGLVAVEYVDSKHFPSRRVRDYINERTLRFLQQARGA